MQIVVDYTYLRVILATQKITKMTLVTTSAVVNPASHIGSMEERYALGSNLILGFLSNDIEGGAVHIRR